jgi:hypothetical protein
VPSLITAVLPRQVTREEFIYSNSPCLARAPADRWVSYLPRDNGIRKAKITRALWMMASNFREPAFKAGNCTLQQEFELLAYPPSPPMTMC